MARDAWAMSDRPSVHSVNANVLVPPVSSISIDGWSVMNALAIGAMERLEAVQPDCTITLLANVGDQEMFTLSASTVATPSDGEEGTAAEADNALTHIRATSSVAVMHLPIPCIFIDDLSGDYIK